MWICSSIYLGLGDYSLNSIEIYDPNIKETYELLPRINKIIQNEYYNKIKQNELKRQSIVK